MANKKKNTQKSTPKSTQKSTTKTNYGASNKKKAPVKKEHGALLIIVLVIMAIHGIFAAYLYYAMRLLLRCSVPWILGMMAVHSLAKSWRLRLVFTIGKVGPVCLCRLDHSGFGCGFDLGRRLVNLLHGAAAGHRRLDVTREMELFRVI